MTRLGKAAIALTIIITLLLGGAAACTTPQVSAPASTTAPSTPPVYYTHTFIIPANSSYSFPIYLRNNVILHLMWWVEPLRVEGGENKVWFHIITPSGKSLGFYEKDGHYANGTLEEGFCRGMVTGITQFNPSDYDWGEGYYTMYPTNDLAGPVTVRVEYWIETK